MYITYATDQISLIRKHRPSDLKEGVSDFRPTWLVRVDDMTRVSGTEAKKEGYCTLSYSWIYSGDIEKDDQGESIYIDRTQHKIIFSQKINGEYKKQVRCVIFKDIIQQICKDFGIKYIWYDKQCIDQDDKVSKQNEIKQMHKIYRNANYTVALIPELQIPDSIKKIHWTSYIKYKFTRIIDRKRAFVEGEAYEQCLHDIVTSEWSKRLWTLEEAIMSRQMVFVGKNAHLWLSMDRLLFGTLLFASPEAPSGAFVNYTVRDRETPHANTVLRQAHTRTTSKAHDRVFALANIFADRVHVDIDYDCPLVPLIHQFYARLAAADLTILCFGKPGDSFQSAISGKYDLPSWTGIEGAHIQDYTVRTTLLKDFREYSVDNDMRMHIHKCRYTKITPSALLDQYDAEVPESIAFGGVKITHLIEGLTVKLAMSGITVVKVSPGKEDKAEWGAATFSLTEACDECIVLEIPYLMNTHTGFPVIKQTGDVFKSIGMLFLKTVDAIQSLYLPNFFDINEGSFVIV